MAKNYDDSWATQTVNIPSKKKGGHGLEKEVRAGVLKAALEEFTAAKKKYGKTAVRAAVQNLRKSLELFDGGDGWTQGTEEEEVSEENDRPVMAYCAIGAIHKADGQAEHLARLAVDLAAGQLFPTRACSGHDLLDPDIDWEKDPEGKNPTYEMYLPDVVSFNDDDATKFKDVRKVFLRGIDLLGA